MSKTTILIVEDDAGLREALLDTLLLGNYEVVAADCAEEALMVLSSRSVDLVVSDIQMGEMSGLTLLKSIKTKYPNMPVLLMMPCRQCAMALQTIYQNRLPQKYCLI